jgi:tetratricopeptide (TPR) repeat protein
MEDYTTAYSELELALSLSRESVHTLSDHRQVSEVLNNLGCLSYMGGEIERSMLFFRESINILNSAVDFATYSESKLESHSTMLALTIAKSNVAFLSLTFYRDVSESVTMFESVIKEQQLLLRDADVSLWATLEHLAAANLLAGDKSKALQLLRRVLRMQTEACGAMESGISNSVCDRTRHKITILEQCDQESIEQYSRRNDGFEISQNSDTTSGCSVTTATGNAILPILETSRESSSGSHSRGRGSSSNGSNGSHNNSNDNSNSSSNNDDNDDHSPNASITNTWKAWRESHAITEESFLTNHVII